MRSFVIELVIAKYVPSEGACPVVCEAAHE
jgi:hypothetical protein